MIKFLFATEVKVLKLVLAEVVTVLKPTFVDDVVPNKIGEAVLLLTGAEAVFVTSILKELLDGAVETGPNEKLGLPIGPVVSPTLLAKGEVIFGKASPALFIFVSALLLDGTVALTKEVPNDDILVVLLFFESYIKLFELVTVEAGLAISNLNPPTFGGLDVVIEDVTTEGLDESATLVVVL